MPVQVLTLNEKERKPSEGQMTADEVLFLGCSKGKARCPSHLKEGHRRLPLQRRILNREELSALGFSIEQQENAL